MKRPLFLVLLALVLTPSFCPAAENRLNVFVTILPQAYFVERVGGDKVEVSVMIPPGGNPHTYEPTPSQWGALSRARIYFKIGSGIEFENQWMAKISSFNRDMPIANTSKGIPLIEENGRGAGYASQGLPDPHVWLSTENAAVMTANIRDALIQADPQNEDFYRARAAKFIEELHALKKEIGAKLSGLTNRLFVVFHPSWGYFASEFNLREMAAEHGGKEPTPKRFARLIEEARNNNVKVIFASPQFSRKSAQVMADEIGATLIFIDPLAKDYIRNLRDVADALAQNGGSMP